MAVDNISKFYDAFNAKYDNFQTEDEFRKFLKSANRENIDNLFNAFNEAYDNFGSADDMISYLGWSDSSRPTTGMGQVEQPEQTTPQHDPQKVAEGRAMFETNRPTQGQGWEATAEAAPVARPTQEVTPEHVKQTVDPQERQVLVDNVTKAYEQSKPITDEYEARWNEYQADIDNELSGPSVDEKKRWLDEHNQEYRDAKAAISEAEGRLNLYDKPKDIDRLREKRAEVRKYNDPTSIIARGTTPFGRDNTVRPNKQAQEHAEYSVADDLYAMAEQTLNQGSKYDPGYNGGWADQLWTAVKQFGEGAANNFDKGSITFGLSEGKALTTARKVGDKYNKIIDETIKSLGYSEEDITKLIDSINNGGEGAEKYLHVMSSIEDAVDKGLSAGEKSILDAFEEYLGAQMKRSQDVSVASAAGAGAEQSAEFMLDFILTGGLTKAGTKAAAKLASKRLMKKLGEKGAKAVSTVLSDAGVAAARTAIMFPRNLQSYGENLTQMTGKDELGRYNFDRSHLNAALNTALTQYIEYWSEGFGEYFGAAEQALFKNVTNAAPRTVIGKTLKGYRGSIGTYLDNGKFDGMFNEMLEEVVGSGFNALAGWMSNDRVGDKEAMKDFFSGEQLATLALSFLPMSAISAATNIKAYNKMKSRYNEGTKVLNPFLESGAISREELDELVSTISEKTPEEIKDKIVDISDKARKANGGYLPKDFAQGLLGYVEGSFSMSLNNETWENSQEKMGVVNAYTDQYNNPDERNAYDLAQLESIARDNAVAAGFDENVLDLDAYSIARYAQGLSESQPAQAQALMQYADAKAANAGLKDGYDAETAEYNKNMADSVYEKADNHGVIIQADTESGERATITSKDVTVGADGKLNTPTGADGLVTYINGNGETMQAKASTFSNVTSQDTETYILDQEDAFAAARELLFEQAKNTISPAGMARALEANVGQTVYVHGNGAYAPVIVERMTDGGANVVISGDKEALIGIATSANIPFFPGGTMLEIPVQDLYPLLATNEDGTLTTDQPEAVETEAPSTTSTTSTVQEGGQQEALTYNGRPVMVNSIDSENGHVYYTHLDDKDGMLMVADLEDFKQQTGYDPAGSVREVRPVSEKPVETETATEPEAPVAETSGIPVDEKTGEPIYDAPGITPLQAYEDIYGKLSEKNADAFVIEQSDLANRNLRKAQKLVNEGDEEKAEIDNWDKNPGEGLNAFLKRQAEAKAKVDEKIGQAKENLPELQRKADFWDELREVAQENISAREKEAARQKLIEKYGVDTSTFDLTPQTAEEAVAEYLGNSENIIDLDDAKKETFGKSGRIPAELFRHLGNGGLLTKNGGRKIADVANDIVGEYEDALSIEQDQVRDLIIDYLTRYTKSEMRDMIFNNRLQAAVAELEQQNGTSEETAIEEDLLAAEEETIPAEEAVEEAPEGTEVPETNGDNTYVETLNGVSYETGGLTADDIIAVYNNRENTKEADKGKPGRKEIVEALLNANPQIYTLYGPYQLAEIEKVYKLAKKYQDLEISKEILGRAKVQRAPVDDNQAEAPAPVEEIKPGDRLNDGTIFQRDDILLRDLAIVIDPWIIERLEGVGYQTAMQVLKSDLSSVALDTDLEMDELAEVYDILRRELAQKKNEAPAAAESRAQNETKTEQTPSESQEESVTSQKEEQQPAPSAPEQERLLTEQEIRNSGYPDSDVIDSAVDYINGERGFAETLAYQQVKEYVRTNTATTEQAGETAGATQLDGQSVQTSSTGAERSGGSADRVDKEGNRERSSRGNGTPGSGVLSGEEGPANNGTQGQQAGANVNGSGKSGRRSGTDESGLQLANDTGRPERNAGSAGQANQRGTEAGSTDIDALGGELDDLLKQFSDTNPSIADVRPSVVESRYPSIATAETKSENGEGRLSSKQVKQPTSSLSLEGLTPQQGALATKIIFTSAKLGYAYAKTEGLTTFNDFKRWFKSKFGDAVMKGLNYNDSSLDAFIAAAWQAKLNIDGKRLTLAEHDAAIHDQELLEQRDVPVSERVARQEAANKKGVQVIRGSRKNIAESVPILTPGQWDDLVAIERQFFDPSHDDYDHCYGKGMLVSNGTGTGKTFTGLGTIKRFIDEGKGRILVVAPAAMKHEWSEKAKLLGIKMTELESKKDKGEGVVVTSYENFRDNAALYEDTFDLVVYDECQNIIENQKGEETMAFAAHRMIANKNVEEAQERLASATEPGRRRTMLRNQLRALETERKKPKPKKGQTKDDRIAEIVLEQRQLEAQIASLTAQVNLLKPGLKEEAEKAVKRTKVLFLSATPFNTIANLRYGAGFIFNYPKIYNSRQEEVEDENQKEQAFWTEWFRGDAPMEQLEVEFGDHLLDELETNWFRSLENGYDYSREHPDVSGMVMAVRFNAAMRALFSNPKYNALKQFADFLDNPLYNSLLYETMKASAMRDRIKEHLAAGRKVVIFHDRLHQTRSTGGNLPPVGPPLATVLDKALDAPSQGMQTPVSEIAEFRREFADVLKWEDGLDYRPVHEQIIDFFATDADRAKYEANRAEAEKKMDEWRKAVDEFARKNPDLTDEEFEEQMPKMPKGAMLEAESVALYNGECSNKEKEQAKSEFNNDDSKKTIICVTTRSGGAGLSLHDTTGKHQRIMIQMALPISPIGFIQAEGRIFRWGNRSNAAFEYPRLGIDKEMEVFAMSFNAKAETVENIAHGFRGRGLKDSIMTGFYESSGNVPIDGEGVGGVERDRRGSTLRGMAKAKHDYGVAQRKGFKTGDVSVPEPIGYMMATWGQATNGDTALIPFAGRGSIARYIPSGIVMNTMEQDISLRTDLQCTAGRPEMKIKDGLFGELNPINKADVILLDGNFDPLTVDAVGSMRKGFAHLSEGGRMIAVVPEGEDLKYALEDFEGIGGLVRMTIKVDPGTLDSNTGPMNIVIVDKVTRPELRSGAPKSSTLDLSSLNKEQLFDQIENVKVPERIIDKQAIKAKKVKAVLTELRKNKLIDRADLRREDDPSGAFVNINMTDRFARGMNKSRYRFDSLRPGYNYWNGKYFNIEFPNTDRLSESSDAIIAYKWIKEQLALPDKEFRRNTDIAGDAKQEDVETLKDLYRSYLKLIRAMTNMTESQLMRIAQGLRPDISAADIDTLNGYPQLREKFEAANHEDEERQEMYDKVAGVAEKLGLDITVYSKDDGFAGGYVPSQNKLEINRLAWARMEDDSKATTLLHEFIHSVTSYALDSAESEVRMSDELYEAANFAKNIFNQITKGEAEDVAPFRGYSLENAHEMMAEMANPKVREKLKNRRMWVTRNNGKRRVYGFEVDGAELTTAWALLNEALDDMLKHADLQLYERYTNKTNNFSWRIDESGHCKREADHNPYAAEMGTEEQEDIDGMLFRDGEGDTPAMSFEDEKAEIKKLRQADGTFMKAPNSKPTHLTEDQWLAVRTTAFKKWFGDWENDPENASKIVDENGEPLVVYHGTKNKFWTFDGGKARGIFADGLNYFALDEQFAQDWARRDDESRREPEDNERLKKAKEKRRAHERELAQGIIKKYEGTGVAYVDTPEWKEYWEHRKEWEKENLDLDGMTLYEAEMELGNRVLGVFINSRKPFNPSERYDAEGKQMLIDLGELEEEPRPMSEMYARGGAYIYYEKRKVVDELKQRGYDSIYLSENVWSDPSKNLRTIAVWDAERIKSATDNVGTYESLNPDIRYREETDADVLERLDSEPKVTAYRAMQFVPDPNGDWEFDLGDGKGVQKGFLYPPMSAKVNGEWRPPVRRGVWERSVEQPELAREDGTFWLDRGDEGGVWAAYNPYFHSSGTMLNDQFKKAQSRDNLVVVEVEIPEREVSASNMNPYHAEKAKDHVGQIDWNAGVIQKQLTGTRPVYLSRWDRPVEIVPVDKVADNVAAMVKGQVETFPTNVVWPQLRAELEKRGIKFVETDNKGNIVSGKDKGKSYGSVYGVLTKEEEKKRDRQRKNAKNEREAARERILAAEREVTNATLDRMSEELGIKINRVGRSQMPNGHKADKGYYNPGTGEMFICMDNVTDERDAIATVFHETVGHHGLRKLFGPYFNEAMVNIYAALDAKGREWVNSYMKRHNLKPGDEGIIIGMEEYMAHLAESGDFKKTAWDKIKEIFGRIVDKLLGTDGFTFTDNELNYILRASYEHLKNPEWLNTTKGKALDTLMKRALGINETDPNRPTDPDGPGAGLRFRDGDTGIANADYNAEMDTRMNKMLTENQDADRPVRVGMEKVMKEVGKDKIEEDEDYVTRHNLASSRAETESHNFELFKFNPMLEQVREVMSRILGQKANKEQRQEAYQRVLDYLYAVSGLERNAYKNAEIEAAKQAAIAAEPDASKHADIDKKYEDMKKDWSGLTSLMGLPSAQWRVAEARAQKMVDDFKVAVGDDAALDELWNRIRACTDFSLEHAYKYGLLTRDEFEKLHGTATQPRMWEYYLPLRGFNERTAEEEFSYANFVNPSVNSVVVKKMNGRWTEADNPLANILNIAETEIVQGQDNWAKQALYRFVLNAGENSLLSQAEPWFVKDPATGKWSMAEPYSGESLEDFENRMKQNKMLHPDEYKKGRRGLRLDSIMANKAHRNEHLIRVKVGGMDKLIWVNGNPALARAVTGIGRAQNLQTIRKASRVLSNLFTTYSLDFTAKNLIRDTIYSRVALMVKEDRAYRHQFGKNWLANFGYGAFAFPMIRLASMWESGKLQAKDPALRTKREQMFIDFMTDGGQTGYTIINSVSQIKKDIERSMRRSGDKAHTFPVFGHYAKAVKTLNEAFELLTRFTAYETSRDMGRSGQRAASDAKEISVNFNRRGAQSGDGIWGNIAAYLGATHYFYNAGVQGFENFLRLFRTSPVKMSVATGGLVLMGILTPMINSMLAGLIGGGDGDDDWYWNLPEWVRRNNLILGTGKWYVAIPLPVEFRAPYGIGDIAGSAFCYDKYPARGFGKVAGDILSTASGILPVNPVEGYTGNGNLGDAALRAVAPDATMFFVDWATNRDYTGRPLWKENPFSETVPKSQGAYASTPKGIVWACQKLAEISGGNVDVAPGLIRDFMNNYGGGFFRAAEDVSKLLFTDVDRPRRWDNVPFFSGFTGHIDEDRSNSFASNALYDYKKMSEDNVKSANAILNTDDVTSAILYDEPETLFERDGITIYQKAKIRKLLDGKDYQLGKMYRDGMNNKYKMKQNLKTGEWYKSREVEREGVNRLRQNWKDMREQWAKMPEGDEKEAFSLNVQEAWHLYYDAQSDLAQRLIDYEYGN